MKMFSTEHTEDTETTTKEHSVFSSVLSVISVEILLDYPRRRARGCDWSYILARC
jgi:hypothetical protein